jgi:ABC-type cobalamin/Fe3+-siderophores transport system ATPase subunit
MALPDEIIPIPNPDKTFHESWYEGRNSLNIPHPFRACLLGRPNSGKTTVIKNIILRAKPVFQHIILIHCDPDYTKEYDDLLCLKLSSIPAPHEWPGQVKTLVILEDLEFKGMSKQQKSNLDRLYGNVSTHKNISCILTAQDFFNVAPCVRRMSNLFVLWASQDLDSMSTIARKAGLTAQELKELFERYAQGPKDSVWLDNTDRTPARIRINGFQVIQ